MWGDSDFLTDYANRDFDGLVETFYKVRWQRFFNAVLDSFDAGEPFVNMRLSKRRTPEMMECARSMQFDEDIWNFECDWAGITVRKDS